MIAANRATQAYRRVESESRSPLELVIMLYDGALRFLGEASDAAARGDLRTRANAISRTLAIIAELQNTLDLEKGGAVAALKKDVTAIDEARKLVTPIRDAWSQVAAQPSLPQAVGAP